MTRKVQVTARDNGEECAAEMLVCDCGGQAFFVYTLVGQNHPHLQCAACGVTYCTGGCEKPESKMAGSRNEPAGS